MAALHCACQQRDVAFVQLLLERDLNMDQQDLFQRCPPRVSRLA